MARLSEPESMVWAAAFATAIHDSNDPEKAVFIAHAAVYKLRSVRISGRRDQAAIRMLVDFRLDDDKEEGT